MTAQSELVVIESAPPAVMLMTSDEARHAISEYKAHQRAQYSIALELYEREGWRALGYGSWYDCARAELGARSQDTADNLINAGRVQRNILQGEVSENSRILNDVKLSTDALLKLRGLSVEDQRIAFQDAMSRSNGRPTAEIMGQVVEEYKPRAVPVAPPTISDKEVISVIKSGAQQVIDHAKSQWIGNAYHTDEETRRENLDRWREIENKVSEVVQPAKLAPLMSSATPEWYTPQHIINKVHDMLGGIDLDPASSSEAQETVEAREWFGLDHPDPRCRDGLAREWHGKVYMNPPYGDAISDWVHRLVHQYDMDNTTEAIALLPGRIDTGWFQPLIERGLAWCIVRGRLKFSGAENSAPFPSVIMYFGDDIPRFCHHFGDLGPIVALYE